MQNNRMKWAIAVGAVVLLATTVVTLRAAEQATQHAPTQSAARDASPAAASGSKAMSAATVHAVTPAGATKQHPPASAPEESATIADDPTTAPDPSQSADNNVSFPTDI
jgi:hypothetical protein